VFVLDAEKFRSKGVKMALNKDIYEAILNGNANQAHAATAAALAAGDQPITLIQESMIPAMDQVGKMYECEETFVPELLLAGRAMKSSMELLKPLLKNSGQKMAVRVIIGTVKGDLHDIGKNIVASMLEGNGFEVIDLGTDVTPEEFVSAVRKSSPQVLCMSALITVTMPAMKSTIDALETAGLRAQVKVLIGGAPVTSQYAKQIGADGYSPDAGGAVSAVKELLNQHAA
jgi:5-methyltetrahydrofolate--homocysteine methyltransferase